MRWAGKPLGEIEEHDVKEYLLEMVEARVARGTFSINLCGIRSFWMDTMGRDWRIFGLAKPRYDKKLPVVLSRGEVWRILDEVTIDVYRVCLTTIYSCGLRLLEGATLQIPQIDSDRMQLHIHGKGGRDRFVPLPEGTLLMLRKLWKTHRSPLWLVPAATRKGLEHSLEIQATPPRDGRARGDLPPQIPGAAVRPASPPHQVMSRDRAASTLIIVTWLAQCGAHPCSCDSLYLTILATSALGIGLFNGNWTDPLANLYAAS